MFFSVITENLNWDILIKHIVLTDGMGLMLKNFNMGVPEEPVCRGDCLKKGGGEKEGVGTPMHTIKL